MADINDDALGIFEFFFRGRPRALFDRAGRFHPADLLLIVLGRKSYMVESCSAASICGEWKNRNID